MSVGEDQSSLSDLPKGGKIQEMANGTYKRWKKKKKKKEVKYSPNALYCDVRSYKPNLPTQ